MVSMTYSYNRTAGLNGEVHLTQGEILYTHTVTMPARFDGAYLDSIVQKLAVTGLRRILRAMERAAGGLTHPTVPERAFRISDSYAGQDRTRVFVTAVAKWKEKPNLTGEMVTEALNAVAYREGISVTSRW